MTKLDAQHRDALETSQFAFPKERKEPLENATHVRNAIARFNQVDGVSDAERDEAWKRIKAAAKKFGVEVNEYSGGWMTDDASFWKCWNSPATVYMLTEQTTYEKLRSESSFKSRVVAQGLYDVLLSNRGTEHAAKGEEHKAA